jgi:hypothetical protein
MSMYTPTTFEEGFMALIAIAFIMLLAPKQN